MVALFTFVFGLVALMLSINALRRPSSPRNRLPAAWLPAMITSELAFLVVSLRLAVGATAIALGVLDDRRGRAGVWMIGLSLVLMIPILIRTRRAVAQAGPGGPLPARSLKEKLTWKIDLPDHISVDEGIEYAPGLTLDIYRADGPPPTNAPALVYVHGGSWTGGDPHRQSRNLFHHLAEAGWLVIPLRYPLSPEATFPDHAVGIKRAVAFLKGPDGRKLGVDPARIVLAGGSAGGHLASLVALTPSLRELQPGFEDTDTRVAGCVALYGVFDFLIRHQTRVDWPVIPTKVMKTTADESPDLYRLASPIDHVHRDAPPFLVIHGTHDSLVPPREAEVFVEALRQISRSPVEYLPVIGAQHGFDAIPSMRTRATSRRIAAFLLSISPVTDAAAS